MGGTRISLALGASCAVMAIASEAHAQAISANPAAAAVDKTQKGALAPKAAGRSMAFTVPLVSGRQVLGDVLIEVSANGSVQVDSQTLRTELGRMLNDAGQAQLDQAIAGRVYISPIDLQQIGIELNFDSSRLELLVVSIAGQMRRVETLGQTESRNDNVELPLIEPASFSSYLNLTGNVEYLSGLGVEKPDLFLNGATRVGGIVIEYDGAFTDQFGEGFGFYRRATRAVYDEPEKFRRFSAGDIRTNTLTLLQTPFLGGIAVEKSRQIFDPFLPAARLGGREIFLDNSSTVDVIINGQKYQTFQLDAGTYDLASLPVQLGSNDVQLVLRDSFGRRQTINLDYFFEPLDLAPGDEEYSFALGVITQNLTFEPNYSNDPAFTGFYRKALSRNLILGGALQASESVQLVGISASIVPQFIPGSFDFEAAASHGRSGTGFAFRSNYRFRTGSNLTRSTQINLNVDYESKGFDTIGSLIPSTFDLLNVGVSYTKGFTDRTYASAGLVYTRRGGGLSDRKTVYADVIHRLNDRIRLTLGAEYGDSEFFASNIGVRAGISVALGGGVRTNADYRSRTETFRANLSRGNDSTVGSVGYDIGFTDTRGDTSADANVDYIGNRFNARASVFTQGQNIGDIGNQQRARVQIGTSIAFADGAVGIGRPIGDAFALAKPHSSLKDKNVITSRSLSGSEYYARSGAFGAAVQGDLSSYSEQDIQYDIDSLDAGYDIGDGTVRVDPPYRGGYMFFVGQDHFVSALGNLMFGSEPAALITGTIVAEDTTEDFDARPFFTNSSGRFGIMGLAPGKTYVVTLRGSGRQFRIKVPADNTGLLRVGTIELPAEVE